MYLDNAATTPLKPEVKDYVISLLDTIHRQCINLVLMRNK